MSTPTPREATSSPAWRAWLHLGGLVVLTGVLEGVAFTTSVPGPVSAGAVLRHLPEFYYGAVPVLAAISVGMLTFSRPGFRQAALLTVVLTLGMLALDLGAGGGTVIVGQGMGVTGSGLSSSLRLVDFTGVPLLETAAALLRGELVIPAERIPPYASGDPLVVASQALQKAGHLILPALLVGLVLGVQAWVSDHVSFRRPVDERVARIALAWILAPAAFFLVLAWAQEIRAHVMLGSAPLAALLLPYVSVGLVGAIGWVKAWRVFRWMA